MAVVRHLGIVLPPYVFGRFVFKIRPTACTCGLTEFFWRVRTRKFTLSNLILHLLGFKDRFAFLTVCRQNAKKRDFLKNQAI